MVSELGESPALHVSDRVQSLGLHAIATNALPSPEYTPRPRAGPDVSSLKVGDEVAAVLWNGGAFAEECVCAASQAIRLPSKALQTHWVSACNSCCRIQHPMPKGWLMVMATL